MPNWLRRIFYAQQSYSALRATVEKGRTSTWRTQNDPKGEFAILSSYLALRVEDGLVRDSADWKRFGFRALFNRRLGALDFDASFEICAVFYADSRRRNVADHLAILLDLDAISRAEIAGGITVDDYFPSGNFGIQIGSAPYG
jgi:hypothetical protein